MVDVAAIVLAVISLVGALGATAVAGWFTLYSDHRKRLTEAERLVQKYRDPLLLAAGDLQSRFYNIVDHSILNYFDSPDRRQKDILMVYTCFLIGQYFAWTNILRRQAQFLCFSTDKENKQLSEALASITKIFATDGYYRPNQPFLLWRGQQLAIGEIMTVKEEGELVCMGYAQFVGKWEEAGFRSWFETIYSGILTLVESRGQPNDSDHRLRQLQHLLIDLMAVLDPKQLRTGGRDSRRCRESPLCQCSKCLLDEPSQAGSKTKKRGARNNRAPV